MSKAFVPKGTVTTFGPAITGTQTYPNTLKEIKTIQFGGMKAGLEDVTNMDSVGNYIERLPTTLDAGDVTLAGNRIPGDAGQAAVLAAFTGQTLMAFSVALPKAGAQTTTGDLFTFQGYVTEDPIDLQYDKAASFNIKVTITGPLTLTPGS